MSFGGSPLGGSPFGGGALLDAGPAPVVTTSLLSAADLAGMRATVATALPDVGTLFQPSPASDGQGGTHNSWTDVGQVACRLLPMPRGKSEELVADHVSAQDEWELHLPLGTIINVSWRVEISSQSYEVIGINDPRTWELDELVRVRRVG